MAYSTVGYLGSFQLVGHTGAEVAQRHNADITEFSFFHDKNFNLIPFL